jgi:hypothetical protein
MPVVCRWNGFRFHFFSNEGDPLEPVHVHVTSWSPSVCMSPRDVPPPSSGFIRR